MFFRSVTANRRANFTGIVVVWRLEFRKDFCNFPCTQREKWPKLDYSKSHVQLQMHTDKKPPEPGFLREDARSWGGEAVGVESKAVAAPQNLCSSVSICGSTLHTEPAAFKARSRARYPPRGRSA